MSTEPMNDDLAQRLADGLVQSAGNIRGAISDMISGILDDDMIENYVSELEWMMKNAGQQIHSMMVDRNRMRAALERVEESGGCSADGQCPWCRESSCHRDDCPATIAGHALDR